MGKDTDEIIKYLLHSWYCDVYWRYRCLEKGRNVEREGEIREKEREKIKKYMLLS